MVHRSKFSMSVKLISKRFDTTEAFFAFIDPNSPSVEVLRIKTYEYASSVEDCLLSRKLECQMTIEMYKINCY